MVNRKYIIITIGRNTDSGPLSKPHWLEFMRSITDQVEGECYAQSTGTRHTLTKESFATYHFLVHPDDNETNTQRLAAIARYYRVPGIDYIHADNQFISQALPLNTYL